MADADSVGKISLDMEVDGDITKQIEDAASKIGESIQNSLKNVGNLNFKGIADTISNTISKSIENSMKNIQSTMENTINKAMANIKGIKIPVNFDIPKNFAMPKQNTRTTTSTRAPPSNINLEVLKSQIDNMAQGLDITNAKIDQQKEKLASLKESYEMAFNEERKNKLQEQILKTEEAINKLTAQSDKAGFKLADLDEQFERMSSAAKSSGNGINSASNSLSRLAALANISDGSLKNMSNNTNKAANSVKSFGNNTNNATRGNYGFLNSMIRWGIVFPVIISGLSTVAKFIGSSLMVNTQFASSLNQIKSNLMTAFMPIYNAVLPALNSLMSALATATAYIASFISQLFGKTYQQSFNSARALQNNVGAMQIAEKQAKKTADSLGGVGKSATDSADNVKKAANEIRSTLSGFDEINKLSTENQDSTIPKIKTPKVPTPAGSGVEVPITPTANMAPIEAATQGWADKFRRILDGLWEPFREAWAAEGVNTINAAKHALQGIEDLIGSIAKSFYTVWTNGTGTRILINMLKILQDMLNIIGDIGVTFANAWNNGNIGTKIIQSLANALNNVLNLMDQMLKSIRKVFAEEGPTFANLFMQALNGTAGVIENVTQKLRWIWDHGGQYAFEGLVRLGAKVGELALFIYNQFVIPFVNWFVNKISPAIAVVLKVLGILFNTMSKIINWLMGSGKPVLDVIIVLVGSFATAWGTVTLAYKTFYGVINTISTVGSLVRNAFMLMTSPIGLVVVAITAAIAVGVLLYQNWDTIKAKAHEIWTDIGNTISKVHSDMQRDTENTMKNVREAYYSNGGGIKGYVAAMMQEMQGILKQGYDVMNDLTNGGFGNMVNTISNYAHSMAQGIRWGLNEAIGAINTMIEGLNSISFNVPDVFGGGSVGFDIPEIPYLAKGGIVDKPTTAMIGEAGKEAVVPLENNTGGLNLLAEGITQRITLQQPQLTMVRNSDSQEKHTDDINKFKKAIIEAITEALKELKGNRNSEKENTSSSANGNITLKVNESEFGKIAIKAINKVQKQAGVTLLNV